MSSFYKSIFQTILLYGSESWVLTQFMMNKLNSFHHMCARNITGKHIKLENGVWEYPSTEQQANLLTIEKYIKKRKKTVEQYIHTQKIYEDKVISKANSQTSRKLVWWESPNGADDEMRLVVTKSSASSERGLPQGMLGTVYENLIFYFSNHT
jgi:hypothetical protein